MHYRMYAESVSGPKYADKGWACQDRSETLEFDDNQFIAVADGHGSNNCFRSDIGAQAAIESAIRKTWMYRVCDCLKDRKYRLHDSAVNNFKFAVWREWQEEVKVHWDAYYELHDHLGETEARYSSVSEKYKKRYETEDLSQRYLYTAYGTTLMFAISTGRQILILQIGDGTCAVLKQNGEWYCPVESDEDNYMNVVVSLCEEKAYLKMRHVILDCNDDSDEMPVAVFLSSDGLDDCFPVYENERHLFELYTVIIENILRSGFAATEDEVTKELLPGLTSMGSNDDISLAYFVTENIESLKSAFEQISEEYRPI